MPPKFVQAKKSVIKGNVSSIETGSIMLDRLVDIYGNQLTMADFGSIMYMTINPGGTFEEIASATDFTVNADGTVTIDTGIVRGLAAKSPYGAGGTASPHGPGDIVIVSDNPQLLQALITYINGIAIAGAPVASNSQRGTVRTALAADINAGTASIGGDPLAITPDQLALSEYGLSLPSAAGVQFVAAVTGMILLYGGFTPPAGFLSCDGSSIAAATYAALAAVLRGRYGYGSGTVFTTTFATSTFNVTAHGLAAGTVVFFSSAGTLPTGISANTPYYVIASGLTLNAFKVSASLNGSSVSLSDNGSGTHSLYTSILLPDFRGRAAIGAGTGTKVATFVSRASNVITASGLSNANNNEFQTGQPVAYSAPGGAMTGLTDATTYYLIRLSNSTFSLASSLANALAGTPISLSSDGIGAQTFTLTLSTRTIGDTGGEEGHSETGSEGASHSHAIRLGGNSGSTHDAVEGVSTAGSVGFSQSGDLGDYISTAGNGTPHNNMQPFGVASYIIKT